MTLLVTSNLVSLVFLDGLRFLGLAFLLYVFFVNVLENHRDHRSGRAAAVRLTHSRFATETLNFGTRFGTNRQRFGYFPLCHEGNAARHAIRSSKFVPEPLPNRDKSGQLYPNLATPAFGARK